MIKKNKGFTPIVVIVAAVVIILALVLILFMGTGHVGEENTMVNTNSGSSMTADSMPSPSPVSSANDNATIEKELNNTVTGSVDSDINSMKQDASGL